MGLFGLMGKAVAGGAKLVGKGLKTVVAEIGKEAKYAGKELAKGTKNTVHKFVEGKTRELKEDLFEGDEYETKHKRAPRQKKVALLESGKVEEKRKTGMSYEEQIHALRELGELFKEGLITQEEFNAKKKQLLEL